MIGLLAALVLAAGLPDAPQMVHLPPDLEHRALALGKGIRCAVCQGLSISDSPSSMARSQLDKVRELIQQGRNDDEIRQYFVARYGEWALLEPTTSGMNWMVWALPALLLLGGFFFVVLFAKRSAAPVPVPAKADAPAAPPADDEYLKAVRAELEK